jgi:hypothetical protein
LSDQAHSVSKQHPFCPHLDARAILVGKLKAALLEADAEKIRPQALKPLARHAAKIAPLLALPKIIDEPRKKGTVREGHLLGSTQFLPSFPRTHRKRDRQALA